MSKFLNDPSPIHDELQRVFQNHHSSLQRWEHLKKVAKSLVHSIEICIKNIIM